MKRSDSLEVKARRKSAPSRDVSEELLLERSRLQAWPCWGCTRCWPGQRRHGKGCPVLYSPLIPSEVHVLAPAQADSSGNAYAGVAGLQRCLLGWLPGCLLPAGAASAVEDLGSQRDPELTHQRLALAGKREKAAGSQPLPPAPCWPGGSWLSAGEQELEPPPKKRKPVEEGNPYSRGCFPGGHSRGLIAHLPLSPSPGTPFPHLFLEGSK